MGNTESTVRRVTLKKDYDESYYIDNMIITEKLANVYMNEESNKCSILSNELSPNSDQSHPSKLNTGVVEHNIQSFSNDDEQVDKPMEQLSQTLNSKLHQLNQLLNEIDQKILSESEKRIFSVNKKYYHIVNPLKEYEEQVTECLNKNEKTPLNCYTLVEDFISKAHNISSQSSI